MFKTILVAAITLSLGLIVGFLVGRYTLERQWSAPYSQVSPETEKRATGHNPSPKAGTKVLKPMPIARSRAALRGMTADDTVVSSVAAVGAGDDDHELHVVVENRGKCTVTSLAGVAYGFDAWGKPAPLLESGENFVAFESKRPLAPGKKLTTATPLQGIEDATLAIAHVDRTTCSDGTDVGASMRERVSHFAIAAVATFALTAASCSPKPRRYESAVQVVRKDIVEKSPEGAALQVDFELEWDACPGDQFQVIRGGKSFAECTDKYGVGDTVPVYVRHFWDERGFYRWDIERLGDCWRTVEPNAPGSYEKGQDCKDVSNHGFKTGFTCNRNPYNSLVKRCPWMARD